MSASAIFAQAALDMITERGVTATFTPYGGSPVSGILVIYEGEISMLADETSEAVVSSEFKSIECLVSALSGVGRDPKKGDTFTIGSTTYTVQSLIERDAYFYRCSVL